MTTIKIAKYKKLDSSKRYSKKQESNLAKRFGGRVTAGSGNKLEKGDVRVEGILRIEAKCTKNKSFSVTLDMINKIKEAALSASPSEVPAIQITFLTDTGVPVEDIALIPVKYLDFIIKDV